MFSLHWMMLTISFLMSPRRPSGFTDIKKPNVSHHPVQAKNRHFNPKLNFHAQLKFYYNLLAWIDTCLKDHVP